MTDEHSITVHDFISTLSDEQQQKDCNTLIQLMSKVSGHEPKIWVTGIIGFDTYHYKYESGREGDCHPIGFAPRKDKLTIYLMDGTERYASLFEKMGKHTLSKACVYIRQLSDVDLDILEQILAQSYTYTKSQDGSMHRAQG